MKTSSRIKKRIVHNVFIGVVFVSCVLCYTLHVRIAQAATIGPVDELTSTTTVSVTVGKPSQQPISSEERFSVYGYTSPNATVNIQSPVYGETQADGKGFYEFKYLFITLFREDLCIVSHDTEGRSTPPLCIPPPTPEANKRVGPVILPPSTSISAGNAYIGDTVTLTGQTIPNVEVKLSLFTDENEKNKTLSLIPEVYAYTIPQLSLSSNAKGEYSIVLPTASSQFIRMFTAAFYDGNSTPKSNTLVLNIFPLWMMLLKFFTNFFSLLKTHLPDLIIISQLYFLVIYLMKRFLDPRAIRAHRGRELAVVHREITLMAHEIALEPENRLALRERE